MTYLWTALLSLLPVFELRGSIPYAMVNGIPWYIAGPFAAAVNILVTPLCWLFLNTVHRLFYGPAVPGESNGPAGPSESSESNEPAGPSRSGEPGTDTNKIDVTAWKGFSWYRTLFDRFVEKTRLKLHSGIEKWGALGVAIFVAIPLPGTGAWTGTLGAWILGLRKRKTFPAVTLGVIAAGIMVTAVMTLGLGALRVFINR